MVRFAQRAMTLFYITIVLFLAYSILMLYYRAGWHAVRLYKPVLSDEPTRISVIIPARNEENNIGLLLDSLQVQSYPPMLYEVIVVNDHSEDNTAAVAGSYPFVKLLHLQTKEINSYKKKAIETGIAAASGELIVTTDADCIVPVHWLKTIAAFYNEKKAAFIAAPVKLTHDHTVLQLFQSLDFLVLQGITAAAVQLRLHNMCNGANLAYERKAFYELNGFDGVDHIASGDDMMLMQKIAERFPNKIFYLLSGDAVVRAAPAASWQAFFSQRIRWASKATHYHDKKIFSVLFLVYFFNLSLLLLLVAGFWDSSLWIGFAGMILGKTFVEMIFIYPVAQFFRETGLLKFLFPFQPLHIVYTLIAGWLGVFGRYKWKGRKVK